MSKKITRKNGFIVRLSDDELSRIQQKMDSLGLKNREAFARKLLLDGYIIQVNMKPTAELVRRITNATTNINQIAKRANETGSVYENDVLGLIAELNRLHPLVVETHKIVAQLSRQ